MLGLAGCHHYYQVQDPASGQMYFTNKWVAADGYHGPLHFTDSKGQHIQLRMARVNRISPEDYLEATAKPNPAKSNPRPRPRALQVRMPSTINQVHHRALARMICASALIAILSLGGCTTTPIPAAQRPSTWAQPVDHDGLPNCFKVSDTLYRGAQPDPKGLYELVSMGIRTVINARSEDYDSAGLAATKINYMHLPMSAFNAHDREVIAFLRIVTDKSTGPVFLHCQHGSDRTGLLCAMYRIAVQDWSKAQAIAEMTQGGMGFHGIFQNLIAYINDADIERLKREAGLLPSRDNVAEAVPKAQ